MNQTITQNGIQYLATDALGSPRIVTGAIGQVVSRHDYMPFGEEVATGVGGRTTVQGYNQADNARQKFTGYERDNESGIDFAQNRYYSGKHGRFTSVDPTLASIRLLDPQSFNRFAYIENDPLNYTDPSGLCIVNGVENKKPCANFSGQVYKNPDGSFSNSDADGGKPYGGPPVTYDAYGVTYTITGGSNGGWTSTGALNSAPGAAAPIECASSEISSNVIARPLEPVPEVPNAAVGVLATNPLTPQAGLALVAIETTELIAGQGLLADGISIQGSFWGSSSGEPICVTGLFSLVGILLSSLEAVRLVQFCEAPTVRK